MFCLLFSVDVKPKNAQCLYTEKAGPHFTNIVAKCAKNHLGYHILRFYAVNVLETWCRFPSWNNILLACCCCFRGNLQPPEKAPIRGNTVPQHDSRTRSSPPSILCTVYSVTHTTPQYWVCQFYPLSLLSQAIAMFWRFDKWNTARGNKINAWKLSLPFVSRLHVRYSREDQEKKDLKSMQEEAKNPALKVYFRAQ